MTEHTLAAAASTSFSFGNPYLAKQLIFALDNVWVAESPVALEQKGVVEVSTKLNTEPPPPGQLGRCVSICPLSLSCSHTRTTCVCVCVCVFRIRTMAHSGTSAARLAARFKRGDVSTTNIHRTILVAISTRGLKRIVDLFPTHVLLNETDDNLDIRCVTANEGICRTRPLSMVSSTPVECAADRLYVGSPPSSRTPLLFDARWRGTTLRVRPGEEWGWSEPFTPPSRGVPTKVLVRRGQTNTVVG